MGRRSIKTTKTGKFMNPTDQWRKEQRRKELKKNRKQRTAVREAVLRMKDPIVLLQEIEEIEKAEGEVSSEPLPNEKGLLEKKRKLHGNLDRIVKYWQKEDPKKAHDIKQLILDSEKKRRETTRLYDSYREARSQCEVSDIPLPETSDGTYIMPSDIPMPDELVPPASPPPPGSTAPRPPGPPPGAPPSDLSRYNIIESTAHQPKRSVRFAPSEEEGEGEGGEEMSDEEGGEGGDSGNESDGEDFDPDALPESSQTKTVPPPTLPRLPPPPPPGPPPLFAPRFPPPGIGIPPGPPPGLPPSLQPPRASIALPPPPPRLLVPPSQSSQPHIQSQAVLTSHQRTPSSTGIAAKTARETGKESQGAIISAQPQLRNIQAEVTKFMPTSLRVRREVPKPTGSKVKAVKPLGQTTGISGAVAGGARGTERGRGGGVQGDAYNAFMKEMEGFL